MHTSLARNLWQAGYSKSEIHTPWKRRTFTTNADSLPNLFGVHFLSVYLNMSSEQVPIEFVTKPFLVGISRVKVAFVLQLTLNQDVSAQ